MGKIKTLMIPADEWHDYAQEASEIVLDGGIIIFPTETVYGIGSLPRLDCVEKLIEMKNRPVRKPIQLLISDFEMLARNNAIMSVQAEKLAKAFWPGPLTLVLDVEPGSLPEPVIKGGNVGFRLPAHELCRDLIRRCGGSLAATSANPSGMPEARSCAESLRFFSGKINVAVDSGVIPESLPSTVAAVSNDDIVILRKGAISEKSLFEALNSD
ncbi:MAG TPA: L-threonylcarbamoyladenylate synthase [bacterium]|nr:L-threonylcarbamoyladenylate synthase [bacterium]